LVTNGTAATAVVVSDSGVFHAVSCRTASICEAVSDGGITPVTDGTPGPTRGGVSGIYLRGVSCPSDTACALVGIGRNQVIPALSPFGFPPGHSEQVVGAGTLWAIACPAVGRCLAVGDGSAGGVVATFLPPTVTTSPQDRTVVAGNPVSFDAAGGGVPTPIVQWQVSTDGGTTFSDIPGAISAAYGFIATAADQDRRYRAVFKNVTGITPTNAATLTVQVPTTTGLVSSLSPSVSGEAVTFTATVNPSPSAGTIQFSVDNAPAGAPVTVNAGHAAVNLSTLAVGTHTVGAAYSGGDNFLGSQGSTGQVVNKAATAVTVGSSAAPSVSGQEVTFTATIAAVAPGAGVPTGTVQVSVDGTKAGEPVPVSSGRAAFTTTSLTAGKHTVAALYSGAANFLASQGSLDQTVNADNPVTIAGPPRDPAGLPVAPVTPPAPAPNPAPKGTLPHTGGHPLPLAVTAVALTLAGGALRKRTRS
jgi:hypothetical protein